MSKIEGKMQAVMVLIAKYIKKQGCTAGAIDFDYDLIMYTNQFTCYSPKSDAYSARHTFPFDVSQLLEEFMDENISRYGEGYTGGEMIIDAETNTVKLFENYEYYDEVSREIVEMTADQNKELAEVCEDYINMNIRQVSWDISGGGDSGYIEDYSYNVEYVNDDDPNKPSSNNISRSASLEDISYSLLNRNFGGWENNEGGQGTLTFYPAEGRLELNMGINESVYNKELVTTFEF